MLQDQSEMARDAQAAWRARVERELAGTSFEKLRIRLIEGFELEPLYTERGNAGRPGWRGGLEVVEVGALFGDGALDMTGVELRGASAVDELGYALHRVVSELREGRQPGLRVGVGPDVLLQVAKLRALRLLLARVGEVVGATLGTRVHAVTSLRHFSKCDPWTNILRNTAAIFAAVVGGADKVTSMPWDICLGAPSEEALRLARNTVRLAVEEAWLDTVEDPAAGSFALEQMTQTLCERAWAAFQAFEAGASVDERIEAAQAQRAARVAKRQDGFIGVTLFPNLSEDVPTREGESGVMTSPRLAEPFEKLRESSKATVFLANIGPIAEHTARATWIRGFYEAGGVVAVTNDGFEDAAQCADAFVESGAKFAVICAADSAFAGLSPFVRALKEAQAAEVVVAGRPGPHEAMLREAGVDQFVFAGMDVLAELRRVRARHFGGAT